MKLLRSIATILVMVNIPTAKSQVITEQVYRGFWKKEVTKNSDGDLCVTGTNAFTFWCLAGSGQDQLNLPKLSGWIYLQYPLESRSVEYISPRFNKLTLNGVSGRFLYGREVHRTYSPGYAGIAPSIESVSSGSTSCWSNATGSISTTGRASTDGFLSGYIAPAPGGYGGGYGYLSGSLTSTTNLSINTQISGQSSTDCTHIPGQISINPGRPGKDPSREQELHEVIVDCTNGSRTYQIIGGHTWQPVATNLKSGSSMKGMIYNEACFSYDSLPSMKFEISNNVFKDF